MATINARITIRPSWWVRPYLAAVLTVAWVMRPFVLGGVIEDWLEREAEFVVRRGMRCGVE